MTSGLLFRNQHNFRSTCATRHYGHEMDRIAIDPRIMDGVPCVRGTGITVATILGPPGEGLSPSDVVTDYPALVLDDVLACLRYAARSMNQ